MKNTYPADKPLIAPNVKNLTHVARLQKQNQDSPLINQINRTQERLNKYAADLYNDPTKTSDQKSKLLYEHSAKHAQALLPAMDKAMAALQAKIATLTQRIEAESKVKGTTDMLLLQSMAQAVSDLSNTQIYSLAKSGEIDAVRAVLLMPVERFKRNLVGQPKTEKYLRDILAEKTLGADYPTYLDLKEQDAHLAEMGAYLVDIYADSEAKVKALNANVAVEPKLEENQ